MYVERSQKKGKQTCLFFGSYVDVNLLVISCKTRIFVKKILTFRIAIVLKDTFDRSEFFQPGSTQI